MHKRILAERVYIYSVAKDLALRNRPVDANTPFGSNVLSTFALAKGLLARGRLAGKVEADRFPYGLIVYYNYGIFACGKVPFGLDLK